MRRLGVDIARNLVLFQIDMPSVITDLFLNYYFYFYFFWLIGAVIV